MVAEFWGTMALERAPALKVNDCAAAEGKDAQAPATSRMQMCFSGGRIPCLFPRYFPPKCPQIKWRCDLLASLQSRVLRKRCWRAARLGLLQIAATASRS